MKQWQQVDNQVIARKESNWVKVEKDTLVVSTAQEVFYLYLEKGLRVCELVEEPNVEVPENILEAIGYLLTIADWEANVRLYNNSKFPHSKIIAAIKQVEEWLESIKKESEE